MPRKNLTASEFVLQTLSADTTLEWRVSDLMERADDRWTEANVYNTLTRLHATGRIKRTKDGHAVWWSAVAGQPMLQPNVDNTPDVALVVEQAAPTVAPVGDTTPRAEAPTAQAFIVDLLTRHPDYEMQVSDIWEEADRRWKQQTVANTLERLVAKGVVARVKHGRNVWFSIAG